MNIEKKLDTQARIAKENINYYWSNAEAFMEADVEDFNNALTKSSVANWAVQKKIESSHEVAKKIIDSI